MRKKPFFVIRSKETSSNRYRERNREKKIKSSVNKPIYDLKWHRKLPTEPPRERRGGVRVAHQIHCLVLDLFQADRLVPGHLSSHHDVRAPTTRRNATTTTTPREETLRRRRSNHYPKPSRTSDLSLSLTPSLNFTEEMRSGKRRERERRETSPYGEVERTPTLPFILLPDPKIGGPRRLPCFTC